MQLPFLQVSRETNAKARMLGGLINMGRREAKGLITDLWEWALELGPPDQPPTGKLVSAKAPRMMCAALEWEGADQQLVDALVEVGLLELLPDGLRVKGTDRYAAAWKKAEEEKQRKAEYRARKAAEEAASQPGPKKPRGTGRGPSGGVRGKKKRETEMKMKIDPLPSEAGPPPPVENLSSTSTGTRGQRLWGLMQEARSARHHKLAERRPGPGQLAGMLKPVLDALGEEQAFQAYCRFLEDSYAQTRQPCCPIQLFLAQWERHVPPREEPKTPCAICHAPAEAAIGPGVPVCYAHVGEFRQAHRDVERPWELAADWAEMRRAEVAA